MTQKITVVFELDVPDGTAAPSASDLATELAIACDRRGDSVDYTLSDPTVWLDPPAVVVDGTGGVYSSAVAEVPVTVVVFDTDESNGFDSPNVFNLPNPIRPDTTLRGWAGVLEATVDPDRAAKYVQIVEAGSVK